MRKVYVLLENWLPLFASFFATCILGSGAYLGLWQSIALGENHKEILTSFITVSAIYTALLGTLKTLLISTSQHSGLNRLLGNKMAFGAFINNICLSIFSNIILIVFCFVLLIKNVNPIPVDFCSLVLFFCAMYSCVSFIWIEYLFMILIKSKK